MTSVELTVFTPFYKNIEYFDECIVSVLSQSFRDFEYLMINDGPVENAQRIGRDHREIERAVAWTTSDDADRFVDAGVTMFQVSVLASDGYDLTELKEALAWRDSRN